MNVVAGVETARRVAADHVPRRWAARQCWESAPRYSCGAGNRNTVHVWVS
jgi:hypothetical protein